MGDIALRVGQASLALSCIVRVDDSAADLLAEVRAVQDESLFDSTRDRCMPAMIRKGRQESLVSCSSLKVGSNVFAAEHVSQRVLVALRPEFISQLDIVL